jgi:choline dehydrogenase-like flavoprotein
MRNQHINAIIIGAGAGGGPVAKELATNGLSVVLFERGTWAKYDDHDDDELISQRTTVLGNAFGPDKDKYWRVRVDPQNGSETIVYPHEGWYNNNAACVGSGTVSYGAMAWRLMPQDFKMKSIYGHMEGSTLDDWPITYEDLEPFYEKAEWEIGVAGINPQNPFVPARKKSLPMPPFDYNREGKILFDAAKRKGWHPFPIPMLRNSVRYNGRPACIHMRTCVGFACPVNAKCGTHNTVIPVALATGNCELRTHCQVAEIIINDHGRATGVKYFDASGKEQIQTADLIVVSASATETSRLLLNSRSKLFPAGAGNNFDWVGRNLQGHAYTGAKGLFDYDVYDDVGPGACVAISDFNHGNEGIIGGGVLANEFIRMPYLFSRQRPPDSPGWGKEHKDFQRKNYKRLVQVMGPFQEMPNFEARITVDLKVKDFWGIPVGKLMGKRHPYDRKGCEFLSARCEEWLLEAGAYKAWKEVGGGPELSGGQHQAGTCRMGNDKKTSVTNRFGQLHEIDNIFIADGSLMVNNGGFNPALTIMALGFYVGNQIVNLWRGTQLKS